MIIVHDECSPGDTNCPESQTCWENYASQSYVAILYVPMMIALAVSFTFAILVRESRFPERSVNEWPSPYSFFSLRNINPEWNNHVLWLEAHYNFSPRSRSKAISHPPTPNDNRRGLRRPTDLSFYADEKGISTPSLSFSGELALPNQHCSDCGDQGPASDEYQPDRDCPHQEGRSRHGHSLSAARNHEFPVFLQTGGRNL